MPRGTNHYDEARLQGRLWTPAAARAGLGLVAWYDAMDLATITMSGSNVTQLADKSGFGRHLTPITTGPTISLMPNSNFKALEYDGASHSLRNSSAGLGTANVAGAFAVAALHSGAGSYGRLISISAGGTDDFAVGGGTIPVLRNASLEGVASYFSGTVRGTGSITYLVPFVVAATNDGATQKFSVNSNSSTATPVASAFTGNYIGVGNRDSVALTDSWRGWVGEVCITLGVAASSDSVRNKFMGYLAHKWNRQHLLAASHPFKNRPPLIGD